MKKLNLTCILALAIISLVFYSCDKCKGIYCVATPGIVSIELVDKQNRDLLDPATPGHYDTAAIRQLNNGIVRVMKPAYGNTGRIRILLGEYFYDNQGTATYNLTPTDQDTVEAATLTVAKDCCVHTELTAFKYNGVSYTDSLSKWHFVIIK